MELFTRLNQQGIFQRDPSHGNRTADLRDGWIVDR